MKKIISRDEVENLWIQEIITETEHYFRGELQQEQRASWLLATSGLLIGIILSLEILIIDKGLKLNNFLILISLIFFLLSTIASILTLNPLSGTKFLKDIKGSDYHINKKKDINIIIKERFKHDEDWSIDSLELRIKYHFRTHYLRNSLKRNTILWSTLFLIFGLVSFSIMALDIIF